MSDTQLALQKREHIDEPPTALADLRARAMAVPVPVMHAALQEYAERRQTFRDWLLSQLTEGLHYGFVPGTEPRFDGKGNTISRQWDKRANDGKGGYKEVVVSPKSWQSKRCLYKAGAEFIIDLMGVRATYAADVAAWQQLGGVAGNFVLKCELISRATDELIGEGIGARKVGTKGGDENNAVKMCQKAALVAAVLNSYGLSDLFTQDTDDQPPAHDNPNQKDGAPQAGSRAERQQPRGDHSKISKDEFAEFTAAWKEDHDGDVEAFKGWCHAATMEEFGAGQQKNWTIGRLRRCRQALDRERGIPEGGAP